MAACGVGWGPSFREQTEQAQSSVGHVADVRPWVTSEGSALMLKHPRERHTALCLQMATRGGTMGNQMSVPQRVQDEEHDWEAGTYKIASDSQCGQNGTPVIISAHTIQHYDEVDLGIRVQTDNVDTSSPRTVEDSTAADASGKDLGKGAKPEAPAAKSRFFLTLSRPVPGRTRDQGMDSSTGAAKPDVSSNTTPANKDPSDSPALLGAAAPGPAMDKSPGLSPAGDQGLPATGTQAPLPPELVSEAPSKRKDSSFFDKFFKLDKGWEKAAAEDQQEAKKAEHPAAVEAKEVPGLSRQSRGVQTGEDIVDSKETEGQEIETSNCSVPGDPEGLEVAREDSPTTDTTENNTAIMSFFRTLVSPNKAKTKREPEDTGAEKSPSPVANLKSDKANFTPQETPGGPQSPKGSPPGQATSPTAAGAAKDSSKEKAGPTSLPLGKLFWKKSVKEESVPTGAEENSVKGDGGITHSEEINGKDSNNQTSNSTEKALTAKATTPPEPEPLGAAQKGKEGSAKDKKSAEVNKQKDNKQEAREPAQCAEQAVGEISALQNGDKSQKRPEKRRQSLGGFLKGLGPKRMSDAQVQTDPVSIGPPGKSK
ncbi:breast carcinoma-amplified sequence 1 isoform X2 [Heterocephalus glaber]|uniref:Breast carcinoma-amplified sequence 1 n=1 Tax=Heterocephalus glaber TaxID=10181 RepID=A0A0P6JAQ1_HETGA|nr:breast carcinoma-amplified sequence 1 isoform X2 [Heterocephalus glaber]